MQNTRIMWKLLARRAKPMHDATKLCTVVMQCAHRNDPIELIRISPLRAEKCCEDSASRCRSAHVGCECAHFLFTLFRSSWPFIEFLGIWLIFHHCSKEWSSDRQFRWRKVSCYRDKCVCPKKVHCVLKCVEQSSSVTRNTYTTCTYNSSIILLFLFFNTKSDYYLRGVSMCEQGLFGNIGFYLFWVFYYFMASNGQRRVRVCVSAAHVNNSTDDRVVVAAAAWDGKYSVEI